MPDTKKHLFDGRAFYSIADTAKLLGTNAANVRKLIGRHRMETRQLRPNSRTFYVSAECIMRVKYDLGATQNTRDAPPFSDTHVRDFFLDNPSDNRNGNISNRFPISYNLKPRIDEIVRLVRSTLSAMEPSDLRAAAVVLLALERLPLVTSGIGISFGFIERVSLGNFSWADIKFFDDSFLLTVGERCEGDTTSSICFSASATDETATGDIAGWLEIAGQLANGRSLSVEELSNHDDVDWLSDVIDPWDR